MPVINNTRKCTLQQPCKGAMTLSSLGDPDAVGLNVSDRVNIATYARTKGQLYRFPRKAEHKGYVWLNYCPWCGADIQPKYAKTKERGVSRGKAKTKR